MNEQEIAWLSGLLEGEGSFLFPPPSEPNVPRVSLQMTDEDVVQRAAALMGVSYIAKHDRKPGKWKPVFHVVAKGQRARELMRLLLPRMGERRATRIKEILARTIDRKPGDNSRKLSDTQVVEIRTRCLAGASSEVLAREYGVSGNIVRQIRSGRYRKSALLPK